MDQIKIGQFIAQIRKEKGLTQRQLADELLISDRTISKWETGKGLPEVSLMLPLCEILGINVNELLSGERLSDDEYIKKAEENIVNILGEKQTNIKRILTSGTIFVITGIAVGLNYSAVFSGSLELKPTILLIISAVITSVLGIILGFTVDRKAGYFECTECHTVFTPSIKTYLKGGLTVTPFSAYFDCPHCGKATYCKRKFTR
ncbi:MAG: helix-turn-helix domain-containing protein [Oscillospiraceae bacterium]